MFISDGAWENRSYSGTLLQSLSWELMYSITFLAKTAVPDLFKWSR